MIYSQARFRNKNTAPQALPISQLFYFIFHPQKLQNCFPISQCDDAIFICDFLEFLFAQELELKY